jgi:alkanesulfonate monooxygenase SsuD/methylene tetrahydromethanopterin reductase-like flavin-dependent oxidoreductase (luciferase family)
MRFGIFLDLRNPEFCRRPWAEHYRAAIDQVVEAERLGADAVWLSEHHFFDDGYLPQPLVLAAAIAARTDRLRIGTAVLLAALRNPLHIAEEAAIVDLVSNGRLELGFGAGWSELEYREFGADISKRYSLTDACFAQVRELLATGGITPGPVQTPVPMWLGYQGPQGAARAGRLGAGLLSLNRSLLTPYVEALVAAGHPADQARMGGVVSIIVADDPDRTAVELMPYLAHQQSTYSRGKRGLTPDGSGRESALEKMRQRYETDGTLPGFAVVTAPQAVEVIRTAVEGLPAQDVYFWASVGGMPDELAARHVELLMTEVRPQLN